MNVLVPLAILASLLGFTFIRAVQGLRETSRDHPGDEAGVTLAVLPGGSAVVTVDAEPQRSPAVAHLVDQAIHDAFTFDGVDGVEVRRAGGELLERRLRPTDAL